eukprot:gnl/TRDRNA2_/TRDRNA2_181359_c0_seq1.p1 gnl/TRDRNA2_/TRDRNA2_181359_c0~~gnl/TRDRNA2_/TRDRNA2_181359_c0_seq1.p1  ORF type:complete len:372 (+),score=89.25 gnl/TRDRNA2_/TRDRNA2_181359_c0_seq1:74-1189(+)
MHDQFLSDAEEGERIKMQSHSKRSMVIALSVASCVLLLRCAASSSSTAGAATSADLDDATLGSTGRPFTVSRTRMLPPAQPLASRLANYQAMRGTAQVPMLVRAEGDGEKQMSVEEALKDPEYRATVEKAMQDPEMQKRMADIQKAMSDPAVQAQAKMMASMMQNQDMQTKFQELRNDPELKAAFDEIEANPASMMKYYNDPEFLTKIGGKMGDAQVKAMMNAEASAGGPVQPPAVSAAEAVTPDSLLQAVRIGDAEAVDDFIALGRGINDADSDGRTPLHFAVGRGDADSVTKLLGAGANIEAVDSKQNTALHYGCGYGRANVVELLLDKGANAQAKNENGKTPADMARLSPENPVAQNVEVMAKLGGSS